MRGCATFAAFTSALRFVSFIAKGSAADAVPVLGQITIKAVRTVQIAADELA